MSPVLRRVRAVLLTRLATGRAVEAGESQTRDRYPREISQRIGPMVRGLRLAGLIVRVGATCTSRPTRHGTVARLWRAVDRAACCELALDDWRWLADRRDEAPVPISRGRAAQMTLPGLD